MTRWQHHRMITAEPVEVALPSATEGVSFQSQITARYRPGRARHHERDSAARAYLTATARKEAAAWQANQSAAAKDAINAKLGQPARCPDGSYKDLVGHIELSLTRSAAAAVDQLCDHQAHVARLRYLKAALYSDPSLLLIDYLHLHPEALNDDLRTTLERYRQLADRLQNHEQWWADVRTAWNELADRTQAPAAAEESMRVLLDVLLRLDRKLAAEHNLPPRTP